MAIRHDTSILTDVTKGKLAKIVSAISGDDKPQQREAPPCVLDVGCGDGILLDFLQERWGKDMIGAYTGVDLAEGMVVEARRRYPKATFFHQDFLTFEEKKGSYDTLIFNEAFHYFTSHAQPLHHALSLLRQQPGSRIVLSHPKGLKSIHLQHEMSPILVPLQAPTVAELKALVAAEGMPLRVLTDEAVDQFNLYLIVLEMEER